MLRFTFLSVEKSSTCDAKWIDFSKNTYKLRINEPIVEEVSFELVNVSDAKSPTKLESKDAVIQHQIPQDESKSGFIASFSHSWTLQLIECATDKKGLTTDIVLGQFLVNLKSLLYGDFLVESSTDDEIDKVGLVKWQVSLDNMTTQSLLSEEDIDAQNFLNVEINKLIEIPREWVDAWIKKSQSVSDSKKKSKHTNDEKHYLECLLTIPGDAEDSNHTLKSTCHSLSEAAAADSENQLIECTFNFSKSHYLSSSDMLELVKFCRGESNQIQVPEATCKIFFKTETLNEEPVTKTDPMYGMGHIDLTPIFQSSVHFLDSTLSLSFDQIDAIETDTTQPNPEESGDNGKDDQVDKNDSEKVQDRFAILSNCQMSIGVKIGFSQQMPQYQARLKEYQTMSKLLSQLDEASEKSANQNNKENVDRESSSDHVEKALRESIGKIVEVTTTEFIKYKKDHDFKSYDFARLQKEFMEHIRKSQLYTELTHKDLKPPIVRYIREHHPNKGYVSDVQFIYDTVQHVVKKCLLEHIKYKTAFDFKSMTYGKDAQKPAIDENDINLTMQRNDLERKSLLQLASDYELMNTGKESFKMARKFYEKSLTLLQDPINQHNSHAPTIEWSILSDAVVSFVAGNKVNEYKNMLLRYFWKQPEHFESLKLLTSLALEFEWDNSRTFVYQFAISAPQADASIDQPPLVKIDQGRSFSETAVVKETISTDDTGPDEHTQDAKPAETDESKETEENVNVPAASKSTTKKTVNDIQNQILSYIFKIYLFKSSALTQNRSHIAWKKLQQLVDSFLISAHHFSEALLAIAYNLMQQHMLSLAETVLELFKQFLESQKSDDAQETTSVSIHKYPASFYLKAACLSLLKKDYASAIENVDVALEINPNVPAPFALKGHALYEMRDTAKAYKYFKRHLELIPGTKESFRPLPDGEDISFIIKQVDIRAMYRFAKIEKASETYKEAYNSFLQAIEFGNHDSWLLWYEAGQCAFQTHNYKDAIDCLMQACTIDKTNLQAWCLLALVHLKDKRFADTVALMTELTKRDTRTLGEDDIKRVTEISETLIQNGWVQYGLLLKEKICSKVAKDVQIVFDSRL